MCHCPSLNPLDYEELLVMAVEADKQCNTLQCSSRIQIDFLHALFVILLDVISGDNIKTNGIKTIYSTVQKS